MTQLRHCKCGLSNHFDDLYAGIGHRGSSFSDIDGMTHDGNTNRFLIQEFKQANEPLEKAQQWMLSGLANIPEHHTVWLVRHRLDGLYEFTQFAQGRKLAVEVSTAQQMRARFAAWWANPTGIIGPPVRVKQDRAPIVNRAVPIELPPIDSRALRAHSASLMSNDGIARQLEFVKSNPDIEDRHVWLEVLEAELQRRTAVIA